MSNWCAPVTIMDWLRGHETFKLYTKNTRPMLTEGNRLKQVEFSKHVRARWGLPIGSKILWTMSSNICKTLS